MVDRQCPRWIGLAILRWPRGSARVTYQGQVAQLVEQRTENPCVGGSIPSLAINPFKHLQPFKAEIRGWHLTNRRLRRRLVP
jgi:hypothetical protein